VTPVNRSGRGSYLGYAAAALIATGVLVPLGLDIARLANFADYVSWCAWLVAMAIVLWRAKPHADAAPERDYLTTGV
jgi:hypothetical protein